MLPPFSSLNQYSQLSNSHVRDLAWSLCSKNRLSVEIPGYHCASLYEDEELTADWINQLDKNPEHLCQFVARESQTRLGKYFETLLKYFFLHSPSSRFLLTEHNYVLRGDATNTQKSTVGELDFILSRESELSHLEVAVKFYLGTTLNGSKQWLGPNAKDSLKRKIQHLQNHQLPLGQKYSPEIKSEYYMQGYLFEHWSNKLNANEKDENLLSNIWCHYQEIKELEKYFPLKWQLLDRSNWLGGLNTSSENNSTRVNSASNIDYALTNETLERAKMFSGLSGLSYNVDTISESARLMVVPNNWPNLFS